MGQTVSFDHFYGGQPDAFSYYRILRLLITSQQFKGLSRARKMLREVGIAFPAGTTYNGI